MVPLEPCQSRWPVVDLQGFDMSTCRQLSAAASLQGGDHCCDVLLNQIPPAAQMGMVSSLQQ
jgi:hypothetical protein